MLSSNDTPNVQIISRKLDLRSNRLDVELIQIWWADAKCGQLFVIVRRWYNQLAKNLVILEKSISTNRSLHFFQNMIFKMKVKVYPLMSGRIGKVVASHADVRVSLRLHWFILCTWRSGGTAHEGGGCTSQLDLPSLTSLSVAGCGWLQLGVPHWATSVH